ncbi:hypothetical protein [Bacillus clarus]|uniref:Uncharacterized protein n=1 Tax=Bacillus clarus TaxID=2338372 RepID=A0A090YB11_9BACI|nr:hypothetical protein [Bacillus clarus]KFM95649.1 hypothetical protein DJ93_5541 [Bacillus clarus]
MNKDKNPEKEKSAIKTDDFANRTFFGSPTIGDVVILGIIILYLLPITRIM